MRRTEVLIPESEYQRLRRMAEEKGRSVSALVREAVARYCPEGSRKARVAAAEQIASMSLDLPIQDWEEIEEEPAHMRGKPCGE